jgi:hypothetical protein
MVYEEEAGEVLTNTTANDNLRVRSFLAQLKTNAEAGERFLGYEILNAKGEAMCAAYSASLATINSTYTVSGIMGVPASALQNLTTSVVLPDILLAPGWSIKIVVAGKKGTDTIPAVRWAYEKIG